MQQIDVKFLRTIGLGQFLGDVEFGSALDITGKVKFFNASSANSTTFKSGNATASVDYTWPTAGPAANNYLLASSTAGVLSWLNAAGTFSPIGGAYVCIGNDATLTGERALTGTSNQITVTDNGANSTVVLSTPQNIHTGASPTFSGLTLSGLTASRLVISNGSSALASNASLSTNGFLYADGSGSLGSTSSATNGQILVGSSGSSPVAATITGTSNQITVTNGAGSITLSTPQNIHTAATPTFGGLTLSGQFLAASGSQANPGWSFSSDSNTGVWNYAADSMAYVVGGNVSFILGANSDVVIGSTLAQLATNATSGFLLIPSCAGTPTGTPTGATGVVPIVYDTTNDKIYVYRSGWKATAALT